MRIKILITIAFLFFLQNVSFAQMYYQNTNNLDNIIIYEANRNNVNRFVLEALTKTLMNDKAILGGFYGMHIVTGEGVSAESLARNLAQLMNLCETVTLREKQDATAQGKTYNSGPYDDIIYNLQAPYGNTSTNTGVTYYKTLYNQILQREKNKNK